MSGREPRGTGRYHPGRWTALLVILGIALGVAGFAWAGTHSTPVGLSELGGIQEVVSSYETARLPQLPEGCSSYRDVSDKWMSAASTHYATTIADVAVRDGQFARNFGPADPSAFLKAELADVEAGLPIEYAVRVMSVEYRKTLANEDVVVWTRVWVGSKKAKAIDAATGAAVGVKGIDSLPTIEYVMRRSDGRWSIVSRVYVDFSPDESVDQYGPESPHGSELNLSGDVLGYTSPVPVPMSPQP